MTRSSSRPIRQIVGDALDDEAIERGLRVVGQRRAARPAVTRRRLGALAAAALMAIVALVVGLRDAPPGPLARADGAPFDGVEAEGAVVARVELTDGSQLEVEPGGRLVTVGNDGRRVIALLERGRALVHVQPGGPRAWTIECGLATVDVVGTRFSLERTETALRVEVMEGVVLVRGENVPDRARRLRAGDTIVVHAPGTDAERAGAQPSSAAALPSSATGPAPAGATSDPASAPVGSAPAAPVARPAEGWRDLARRGVHREAYDALGGGGVASAASTASVDDLFLLADVARLSGRPAEAVLPLQRIVEAHAGDGRAGLAALTLGRLRLDQLGQPGRAAGDLEVALSLGLPASLQDDCLGRIIEARALAGDAEGARRAAERYLARHPGGRHAAKARAQLGETP